MSVTFYLFTFLEAGHLPKMKLILFILVLITWGHVYIFNYFSPNFIVVGRVSLFFPCVLLSFSVEVESIVSCLFD